MLKETQTTQCLHCYHGHLWEDNVGNFHKIL